MGVVGLLSNSGDGKIAFVDDKQDEMSMLLSDSQFPVKYLMKFPVMALVPY